MMLYEFDDIELAALGEEYPYDEEPEDHEQAVWHRYEIRSNADGTATVHNSTNDNRDLGYPTEDAYWTTEFRTVDAALSHCGKSRRGFMGCIVTVTLDGEEVR